MSKCLTWIGILLCVTLVSCTRVTQSNYDKIQPGMTMEQVEALLGPPNRIDSINIAGLSGTSASWRSNNAVIFIQFFNNQVKIKSMNKPDPEFYLSPEEEKKYKEEQQNKSRNNRHSQVILPIPTSTIEKIEL